MHLRCATLKRNEIFTDSLNRATKKIYINCMCHTRIIYIYIPIYIYIYKHAHMVYTWKFERVVGGKNRQSEKRRLCSDHKDHMCRTCPHPESRGGGGGGGHPPRPPFYLTPGEHYRKPIMTRDSPTVNMQCAPIQYTTHSCTMLFLRR